MNFDSGRSVKILIFVCYTRTSHANKQSVEVKMKENQTLFADACL